MSKIWVVIIGVFCAFFAADKLLGAVAGIRQNQHFSQISDLKQVGDVIQTDGSVNPDAMKPTTEMGKAMQLSLSKLQARMKKLEKDLQACYMSNPMDWKTVSTTQGRKDALMWLKGERHAYDSYNRDAQKIQMEMGKISSGSSGSKLVATTLRKVNLLRAATYDSYEAYIRGVGNSELTTQNGEVFFVHEKDRVKCEQLMNRCTASEKEFTQFSQEAERLRAKELAKIKDRMASYPL